MCNYKRQKIYEIKHASWVIVQSSEIRGMDASFIDNIDATNAVGFHDDVIRENIQVI